ncbi:MAG: pilus assembly protein [Nocardioidaceae bacterium]|nr:pilus assembly protein [Nocardioidaceae bacterium]
MTWPSAAHRARTQQGSALVDFALVAVVLVPLFFGVLQLGLMWHVKTTLTSAASEGARFGAAYNRSYAEGATRTSQVIAEVFGADFHDAVTASESSIRGQPVVAVSVEAEVPVIAFWGPTTTVTVESHAIKEFLP